MQERALDMEDLCDALLMLASPDARAELPSKAVLIGDQLTVFDLLVSSRAHPVGVALTLVAFTLSSVVAFALSLVLAGAGFGTTLQGAIRTVLPAAGEHQRAGLLSLVYVVSYLGMGLPAVIAGFLVVYGGGLRATAVQYGLVVMALAAVALVGLKKTQPARNLSRS